MSTAIKNLHEEPNIPLNDWSEARDYFRDHLASLAEARGENFYKSAPDSFNAAIAMCQQKFPDLNKDSLPFRLSRKATNRFEAEFRAKFESGGQRIDKEAVAVEARKAIREALGEYAKRLELATNKLIGNNFAVFSEEEKVPILNHLMRMFLDSAPGVGDSYMSELNELGELTAEERKERINSAAALPPAETAHAEILERLENIPCDDEEHKIIRYDNRAIVAMKFDQIIMPFYQSAGRNEKDNVIGGQWYPFFGIDKTSGWFNKIDREHNSRTIGNFYGNAKLRAMATQLNEELGDLREVGGIAEVGQGTDEWRKFLSGSFEMINPNSGAPPEQQLGILLGNLSVVDRIGTESRQDVPLPARHASAEEQVVGALSEQKEQDNQ